MSSSVCTETRTYTHAILNSCMKVLRQLFVHILFRAPALRLRSRESIMLHVALKWAGGIRRSRQLDTTPKSRELHNTYAPDISIVRNTLLKSKRAIFADILPPAERHPAVAELKYTRDRAKSH